MKMTRSAAIWFGMLSLAVSALAADPLPLPKSTPWDVKRLQATTPEFEWIQREGPVRSLTYRGEPYQGQPTRVFAYYASPATVGNTSAQRLSLIHI